jgi:hypothetical protein
MNRLNSSPRRIAIGAGLVVVGSIGLALAAAGPSAFQGIWNGGFHGVAAQMGCDGSTPANCALGVVLFDSFGNPIDRKLTYRFSVTGITPIAAPTDMLRICGSATKTVRVKRIVMAGKATTGGQLTAALIRRSTAGTIGSATLSAVTAEPHDSGDAVPTGTVSYIQTANYSVLGTTAGQAGVQRAYLNTLAGGPTTPAVFEFSRQTGTATPQDKPQTLRGILDCLVVSGNGDTLPSGAALDFEVETEEDNS